MKYCVLVCTLLLSGCVHQIRLDAEYTAAGAQYRSASHQPVVPTPKQVRVYYKGSPAGFSLRDNELKVEDGFDHRILGEVKIRGLGDERGCTPEEAPSQQDVFAALQAKAYAIGANAVIYAYSEVSQKGSENDCTAALKLNDFGGAWAVVVSPEHLAPAPPAPAPPPSSSSARSPRQPAPTTCAEWQQRISAASNGKGKAEVIRNTPTECLQAAN